MRPPQKINRGPAIRRAKRDLARAARLSAIPKKYRNDLLGNTDPLAEAIRHYDRDQFRKSGAHRAHSKRHSKHNRGNANRPIADSMAPRLGNAWERRAQS